MVNFGVSSGNDAGRDKLGDPERLGPCAGGNAMRARVSLPPAWKAEAMGDLMQDAAADLLEALARAIAEAAADPGADTLHHAQARAALAAIEGAGFAILPRPAREVCGSLGSALAKAERGSAAAGEGNDDIQAARHWLHGVAAVLDRMPEG
jgi:hypothetical protein